MYIDTKDSDSTGRIVLNANKADKLATARTITLSGNLKGSFNFDGSSNVTASTTVIGAKMTDHLWLTGAVANSSTANTSQIIFGTEDDNHVAVSSNNNALIINPTASTTTNQIVLYLDSPSVFPSGIKANITGNLTGNASTASKLGTSTVGAAADRPIYLNAGTATATTYRMAATNTTATTALSIANDLPTGIWYVNGTSNVSDFNQTDGVCIANQYNDKWITEIYQDYRTGQLAIRGKNNGTWQAWRKVLDSTNYTNYTPTKTGSGASGTWGISITGNAKTATSATKATQDGNGATISSTYLKLSGGTMTGVLTLLGSQYEDAYNGALNCNNSDIYGLNSIYTCDLADSSAEGIHFYRTATTVDTLWVSNGVMYFTPNRTLKSTGTSYTILHSGNYSSTLDSRYLRKDTNDTMSGVLTLGKYTNQSTIPSGGIKIHDIRSITPYPGMFGEKRANFYFFQADGSRWSSILNMHGWTANDYASWEIAGNSHTDTTAVGTFKYRVGKNDVWSNWHSVLLVDDNTGRLAQKLKFDSINLSESTAAKGLDYVCGITAFADGGELQWKSIDSLKVGYATKDGSGNTITSTYLKLSGGTLTGSLTISNGADICLQAVSGSNDSGDIIFRDGAGAEIGRLWISNSTLNFRNAENAGSQVVLHTGNYTSYLDSRYLKLSGGTMSGALNFANGTWNNVGDDCALGDYNQAGVIGIKGLNGATGIYFVPYSGSVAQKITIDGAGTMSITGKVSMGTLQLIQNGVTSTIGSQNSGWLHYSTNSSSGHWFNTNVAVQGNIYAGTNYNQLVLHAGNYSSYALPLSGGTMSGTINMNNHAINNIGELTFSDPGVQEGITWTGGNGWYIYESPDDLTNAAGNLQFVHGSTRRLTIRTNGTVNINGTLQMSGPIQTSFKSSVAMGSYQAAATTVPDLVEELRYSSGAMGSVSLSTAYATSNGGTINAGWYNFIYSPHRSGGSSGAASGDNHNYGTLILSAMTSNDRMWTIRVTSGTIAQSKRIWCSGDSVTGAVWNDYAECRESDCEDFGYVLMEVGNDSLTKTTERLSHFAGVSSDTWGFSQGETDKAKTPIAVAGRVLVYPYQNRNNYKPGDCVCAAPEGKVDIMTREEIINWPDRIVGTVSCVPDYEEWGGGECADRPTVKVNGRIWIKVR